MNRGTAWCRTQDAMRCVCCLLPWQNEALGSCQAAKVRPLLEGCWHMFYAEEARDEPPPPTAPTLSLLNTPPASEESMVRFATFRERGRGQ